jgi:spore maturation protein CgeB
MCKRAFETLGHKVTFVNQDIDTLPLLGRFGFGVKKMRKRIISDCADADPDLVFIIKGYELDRETIRQVQERTDSVVANWNPDNPFQVRSQTDHAETHLESLPAYDIVLTWGKFLMDQLREHGAQRVEHLPFGYDPSLHRPMDPSSEYSCDVIFLGHWSKKREQILSHVANLDANINLWGNYWRSRCWNRSLRRCLRGDARLGNEYARAMSSAKIVINVLADHNLPACNMRTFEIPATGSFMLTTYSESQQQIFEPGREVDMYSSGDELKERIEYYLDDDEKRKKIADLGHNRVQDQSYRHRMKRVLDVAEI